MLATMTKPVTALLARFKPRGERLTSDQKLDRLLDTVNRVPTPEQVMKEVERLARLERKIQQRTARHAARDLARAKAAAEREAADRHPAIVRPAVQLEDGERWDGLS